MRNPIDRFSAGLPHPARVVIDWIVTLGGAIAVVLLLKAYVVNPYRIPSSSMEPTLHCAIPVQGCEANRSDRVLANRFLYHLREPRRGDVIVFQTPPEALAECGASGTFVNDERVQARALEDGDRISLAGAHTLVVRVQ